jgi:hypothetical protein
MSNGHNYTMLVSDHELDTLFFREESSKVYNYTKYWVTDSTYWQGEELWYDFLKGPRDTVAVRCYRVAFNGIENVDTVIVIVTNVGYITLFGQTRRQWEFFEKSLQLSVYAVRDVVDRVGMTYYTYEPGMFSYELRGAIIDGVQHGSITGVGGNKCAFPARYQLSQNYPNPFNPTSTIEYSLPQKSLVSLKLYDLLGREVRTLVNGEQEPGNYSRIVDANSAAGGLPSGVYFYRLQAGNYTDIKKMLLLK